MWVVFSTLFDSFLAGVVAFPALGILRGPQAWESEHVVSSTYHPLQNLWHFQVELEQEADDEGPLESPPSHLGLSLGGRLRPESACKLHPASLHPRACEVQKRIPSPTGLTTPQAQLTGKTKSDNLMKKKKKKRVQAPESGNPSSNHSPPFSGCLTWAHHFITCKRAIMVEFTSWNGHEKEMTTCVKSSTQE